MGRKKIVENGIPRTVRVEESILNARPEEFEKDSAWLRKLIRLGYERYITGDIEDIDPESIEIEEIPNGSITEEQKAAVIYVDKFFAELFENDVLEDYLEREGLMENFTKLGELKE